jgi:adenylate kinase
MTKIATTLIGANGAGKGTVSKWLSSNFGWGHLSSGDRFRGLIDNSPDRDLAAYLSQYVPKGRLVPDPLVGSLADGWLGEPAFSEAVILDGLPRTGPQCLALYDDILPAHGFEVGPIIHIDCTRHELEERLRFRKICTECGAIWNDLTNPSAIPDICDFCPGSLAPRPDDAPDILKKRLDLHFNHVGDVLELLGDRVTTIRYPNTMSVRELFEQVSSAFTGVGYLAMVA